MTWNKDHTKHFIICTIATLAVFAVYATFLPFWHVFAMCPLLGIGLGIGKEYGDSQAFGNKWDWTDIGADLLGIVAAMVLILGLYGINALIHRLIG